MGPASPHWLNAPSPWLARGGNDAALFLQPSTGFARSTPGLGTVTPVLPADFLALGGGTAALAALTACAQGSATRRQDDAITLWAAFNRNSDRQYFEKNIIQAFNADHDFKVNLTVKNIESLERLQQTAIASGQGPGHRGHEWPVVRAGVHHRGQARRARLLRREGRLGRQAASLGVRRRQGRGKLYSIPNSFETMVGFINKEVLDEVRLDRRPPPATSSRVSAPRRRARA